MDAWAAMFGTGVAEEGQALHLSGTSEVLGLISSTRNAVPGVVSFAPWRGITLHAAPTQAGGAALDWAGRLTGRDAAGMAALAETARRDPAAPLFLPHLAGERAPLWDAQARGTFAGLTLADGPAEVARAVMEGVAFQARLAMEALEAAGGRRAAVIQGGGGGTASDLWCRLRADACGRPFRRMAARNAGAVGAAVMAGVAAGLLPDLAAAARRLVPEDRVFLPDPEGAALADRRFALWRDLYAQVRPVNAGLAALV
jgi:xylulokinase